MAVVGTWHSHVWSPPEPSPSDLAAAWPDLAQVIVGPAAHPTPRVQAWFVHGGTPARAAIAADTIVGRDPP
jgi:hypothetical protein